MSIIELILTLFTAFFAPVPWLIIAIHIGIKNAWFKNRSVKYSLIFIFTIIWALLSYWLFINSSLLFQETFNNTILSIFGALILAFAGFIEITTQLHLGSARVFGSGEFKQEKDTLITTGIYKYARHPRYLEHPLWALGIALFFGYTFFLYFFVYLLILFNVVAYFEEQELIQRYGEKYLAYKKKTPAYFI